MIIPSVFNPIGSLDSESIITNIKKIHEKVPLEGKNPNELLTLPNDLLLYLIFGMRDTPIKAPSYPIDIWTHFLDLIRPHNILIFGYNISVWPEECQPPSIIMRELIDEIHNATANSMLMDLQLNKVFKALTDGEIPVILYKGQSLARSMYPDPAVRISQDVDLLIEPKNMSKAIIFMKRLGYLIPKKSLPGALHYDADQQFYPPKKWMHHIEIHWSADHNYKFFYEGWLDNAFKHSLNVKTKNVSIITLNNIDHLSSLIFHHFIRHDSIRLDWIMDLSYLFKSLNNDEWDKMVDLSIMNNIRIPLEMGVILSSLYFEFTVPRKYSNYSEWPEPSLKEIKIWDQLLFFPAFLREPIFILKATNSICCKFYCIYRIIFSSIVFLFMIYREDYYKDNLFINIRNFFRFFSD